MYEYHPTNNIDFDKLDYVAILGSMGVNLAPTPVILGILGDEDRFRRAARYMGYIMKHSKLPKSYLRDVLDNEVKKESMTSLDKAWIVLHVNRLLKDLDFL